MLEKKEFSLNKKIKDAIFVLIHIEQFILLLSFIIHSEKTVSDTDMYRYHYFWIVQHILSYFIVHDNSNSVDIA